MKIKHENVHFSQPWSLIVLWANIFHDIVTDHNRMLACNMFIKPEITFSWIPDNKVQ